MKHCKSILNPIVEQAKEMVDQGAALSEIKQHIVYEVNKHQRMNVEDRHTIIRKVNSMPNTLKLLEYLYSSLLKFEGLGVI